MHHFLPLSPPGRISELMAEHEAQRQEDQLALQEKQKRILELEEELSTRSQVEDSRLVEAEQRLAEQRKVGAWQEGGAGERTCLVCYRHV